MSIPSTSAAAPRSLPLAVLRHPLSSSSSRPPVDDLISSWILEFVLRQPIPDWLVHEIFFSLPFSSCVFHPHLRKAVLLFRLASELRRRTFSERTLCSLELIEDLDRLQGSAPSDSMKAAYCAVAVECTAAALRRSAADFAGTVDRIWMSRVADLARSEAAVGLVSDPLIEWANKITRWLPSGAGGEALVNRDIKEAIRLLSAYLDEAMEEMGPPFLESAAMEVLDNTMNLGRAGEKVGDVAIGRDDSLGELDGKDKGLQEDVVGVQPEGLAGVCAMAQDDTSEKKLESCGIREEVVDLCNASTKQGCSPNVVELDVDSKELEGDTLGQVNKGGQGVIHNIAREEVLKVKEDLRKSCLELRMAVKDPLPQVKAFAAAVMARTRRNSTANAVLPDSPVELVSGEPAKECNNEDVARPSIFERNPTAHTSEWSDESVSSVERSAVVRKEKALKSKRIAVPHLINGKLIKRRPVKRWSSVEETTLREGVAKYGKGNWSLILSRYAQVFEERTDVDLKDKWRSMSRYLL